MKLENSKFVKSSYQPAVNEHLTPKIYVDSSIDEPSLVRKNQDNTFNNNNLTNINSITLNTQAVNDNEVITKAYIDQFHQEIGSYRRNTGLLFYDEEVDLVKNNQDNDFNVKKSINSDSVVVNREPSSDNELANRKYIDDELDKNTVLSFSQTRQSYLKVSIGNDSYNFTKYDKIQRTDTTIIKAPNLWWVSITKLGYKM